MSPEESRDDRTQPSPTLVAGAMVAQYRIISLLGAGGMGEVYLADDTSLNRRVALKFLSRELSADHECRARFTNEARAAARISHPHTVTVYEVGEFDGRPFFAMRHIDGRSLKECIAGGPLPLHRLLRLTIQICEGLQAAHESGIIHRDIKPANILLDSRGEACLADFGLACMFGGDHLTRHGSILGTVGYMSPEQIRGESVDHRSDLFSLGVVLYEMATGTLPFTGAYLAAVTYAVVNESPPRPSGISPALPVELERLILDLLEKRPEKRPADIAAVLARLHALVETPSAAVRTRRVTRRRLAAAIITVAVTLVVALAVWQFTLRSGAVNTARPMVAVLPFENLGPTADEYFADGITDDIINFLARNPRIGVISRNSSILYKKADRSTRQIGRELGVDYLLQGTIQWERAPGNRVRINAALIATETDLNIWRASYDRQLNAIFDLQREVALAVGEALNRTVALNASASPTPTIDAYDFYLRGNEYFNRSWDRDDIEIAAGLYRRAIAIDTAFANAYAMLARAEASMFWEYFDHSPERCRDAYAAARRALELRPDLPEGHLALGYASYHCDRDYAAALAEWERGLALEPGNSELHNAVAAVYRRQGNLAQAADGFRRALELDPRSHLKAFDVALTYGMMRRYTESDHYLRRTIELAPDYALAHIYRAWLPILQNGDTAAARAIIGQAAAMTDLSQSKYYWWILRLLNPPGQYVAAAMTAATDTVTYLLYRAQAARLFSRDDEEYRCADSARRLLELKVAAAPDDAQYQSALGLAYAGTHEADKAIACAVRATELLPTSREAFDAPFLLLNLAEVLVIFGQYDAAVEQLTTLLSIPGFASAAYLRIDPLWQPLHSHPGFQQLLAGADQSSS